MSTLYIVATPIGNLEDISMRALRVLSEVDFVLCEDTRVTRKLMDHYGVKTPAISCHQHSNQRQMDKILQLLDQGKSLALVSDAGTPGISDPGGKLVAMVLERYGDDVRIESVPGPSAVTAALSISGIPTDKFLFLGFPPHKKGRQTFLEKIFESVFPVVVYESKHRIIKFLEEIQVLNRKYADRRAEQDVLGGNKKEKEKIPAPLSSVVVCRELSKMHETVYRGELKDVIGKIKSNQDDQKGEFTVILGR